MNESEKERLIKKDIESIENRVRHAFNQEYEMGLKEGCSEIPNTCGDAISREELIEALDTWDKFGYAPTNELIPLRGNVDKDKYVPYIHYDDVIESIKGMPSVTKQPCDDAISRQAVLNAMYELCDTGETLKENPWRDNPHIDGVVEAIEELPSVTPQQRTGHWIDIMVGDMPAQACDQCNTFYPLAYTGGGHKYCPNCGCKMEVEE